MEFGRTIAADHCGHFVAAARTMPRNLTQIVTLSPKGSRALNRGIADKKAISGNSDLPQE
jgi:hypothetical protein